MPNKILLLSVIALLSAFDGMAQQLPLGTCGIVCTYDAAGNRLKRVYFCNNGIDPYPTKTQKVPPHETTEYQMVDALYPNPTTGKFSVTFSKPLQNANVGIFDNNGKVLARFKGNGNLIQFDLSLYAAGVYYIRVEENGKTISKKVVKQ